MEDSFYREIILEHWQNPQNYGVLFDAAIDVEGDNPICGDRIRLMLNIKGDRVSTILFTSEGCAISKASASLFTEKIKGKKITEIKHMSDQTVLADFPVALTPARAKCALLVFRTLRESPQFFG